MLGHFLYQENVLMCQCCLLYSHLGTCWWNTLCHLRLALLQPVEEKLPGKGSLLPLKATPLASHHTDIAQSQSFCSLDLHATSLSWVCLGHMRPWCFFLPFWFIQHHPLSKNMNSDGGFHFSNTLGRALHIWDISCCLLQHVCRGCLQTAQWMQQDVSIKPQCPFQLFPPIIYPRYYGAHAQIVLLCSHCSGASVFPISSRVPTFTRKLCHTLHPTAVRRNEQSWKTYQLTGKCWGIAVDVHSWEADISSNICRPAFCPDDSALS